MTEDLRTEKEILHQMEERIDEIHAYLYGGVGASPYGKENSLRRRIELNVENIIGAYQINMLNRLNTIQDKQDEPTFTVGGIILFTLLLSGLLGIFYAWINFM